MRHLHFHITPFPKGKAFLLAVLLVLAHALLHAQRQRSIFERVNKLEVVPEVFSVDTDEYGRLWYSTWGRGVFCYDGYNSTRYMTDSDNPNSIANDRVYDILLDKRQRVWVATLGGLSCIDRKTGNTMRYQNVHDSIGQIQTLYQDHSGTIWIGATSGLLRFNENTGKLEALEPTPGTERTSGRARSFMEDAHGVLWALRNDGLYRIEKNGNSYEKTAVIAPKGEEISLLQSLLQTSEGDYLMGTEEGLFHLNIQNGHLARVELPDSLPYQRVNCMLEAPKGVFWIGYNRLGLLRWEPAQKSTQLFQHNPLDPGSLPFNTIFSLVTDRFENLWIGTAQHVVRINLLKQAFALWPIQPEDPLARDNSLVRIVEDESGGILIRSVQNLYFLENLGGTPVPVLIEGKKVLPWDFYQSTGGTVWAIAGGLYQWNPDKKQFFRFRTPPETGTILNICEDSDNPSLLWLGTDTGLKSFDRRSGELHAHGGDQARQKVYHPLDDGRGSLWFDQPRALVRMDKKTGQVQIFNSDSLPPHQLANNEILDMRLSPDGWLWVTTTGGISRVELSSGRFHNLTRKNGLIDNVTSTVLFDQQSNAWIVTPEHIQRMEPTTGKITTFNTTATYQTGTWTRGHCERKNGQLLFAGTRGLLSLQPDQANESRPVSAILITRFEISEQGRKKNIHTEFLRHLQLSNHENNLTIEWAGIQTARSGELRYECKLELKGEQSEWEQKGPERQSVYANLDPGAYTFRVRIAGSEQPEQSLEFAIAPAWYQAESFKMLLLALLATAAYLFWRNREDRQELLKQKELAEQTARYKSRFLANMSHEIRTPMNAILGLSRLLTESKLPPKQSEYADAIRQSSENLLVIVNDVLDQIKIESGQFKFQHKPFDLELILRHLKNTLGFKAEEKGLLFELKLAPGTPTRLVGDPVRLNQILTNLLGNAIKFTESGRVELVVGSSSGSGQEAVAVGYSAARPLPTATATAPASCLLTFTVSDTGIGIPPEQVSRVFESFQQADEEISANYGGTGLGLSITKDLVEQQGGQISLESEVGKGTVISAVIPFELDIMAESKAQQSKQSTVQFEGLRILLVEDTFFNQMLAIELLKSRIPGVEIEVAENGRVALEKLEADGSYHLVLMDVKMPVMDGLEATRRIRANAQWAQLPIIALTANAVQAELDKCREVGMNACVTKPIDAEELFATMDRVIGGIGRLDD